MKSKLVAVLFYILCKIIGYCQRLHRYEAKGTRLRNDVWLLQFCRLLWNAMLNLRFDGYATVMLRMY